MALYLGIDIGTTTLSAVVLDTATGELAARVTCANAASISDSATGAMRAELCLESLRELVIELLGRVSVSLASRAGEVQGIGVTGQMHGVAFLTPDATPVRPAITWQDRRAEELTPDGQETYLQRLITLAGGQEAFERMGCLPASGYLGTSLFWLHINGVLPLSPVVVCFIPDAVVSFLTGQPPHTDPTNGGSSGIFDIAECDWDWHLVERLGLPEEILPPVRESGAFAGDLQPAFAEHVGLPSGIPVFTAMGDNQASFLGSLRDPSQSLLVNVGTGGQISALTGEFCRLPGIDTRAFPEDRYLLVGAGLFGGRSYGYLQEFFRQVGATLFGTASNETLYPLMNRLAAAVSPGADGVRCSPLFTGTRVNPMAKAEFTGLTPENFTPGHLIRSLLEGMAEGFYQFYQQMQPVIGDRAQLVGAGNGVRENPLFAEILSARFEQRLCVPSLEEEAAVGAALLASFRAGEFPDLDSGSRILCYKRLDAPQSGSKPC